MVLILLNNVFIEKACVLESLIVLTTPWEVGLIGGAGSRIAGVNWPKFLLQEKEEEYKPFHELAKNPNIKRKVIVVTLYCSIYLFSLFIYFIEV